MPASVIDNTTLRALAIVIVLLCAAHPAAAAKAKGTQQIDIQYVVPKTDAMKPVYDYVREGRGLEKIKVLLSPLRLPRRLLIKTESCNGVSNAWYDGEAVTVCYEFLDDIWKNAATGPGPGGLMPIDTLLGPFYDVVLHEVGHAVFDILHIPLFGREEDAADQFSVFIVLQDTKPAARRLVLGNAWQYRNDLRSAGPPPTLKSFADSHGTSAQRFFNVLCMAYGADPELFKDVVELDYLPKDRAEYCEDEYQQVLYAFRTLIGPHIDRKLAQGTTRSYLPSSQRKLKRRPDTRR